MSDGTEAWLRRMAWRDLSLFLLMTLGLVAILAALVYFSDGNALDHYEDKLGDGTPVTCFVARGYRSASVNCIPHKETK